MNKIIFIFILLISFSSQAKLVQLSIPDSRSFLVALRSMGVKPDIMKVLHHVENLVCKSYRFQGPPIKAPGRNLPLFEFWTCSVVDKQQPHDVPLRDGTNNASIIAQLIAAASPKNVTGKIYHKEIKVSAITCIGTEEFIPGRNQEVSPNCVFEQ